MPLQQVEVIGTSPLPGQGIDRDRLPYASQVVRRGAIDAAQADNATDYMARRMSGVQVNDIQGSPFQADLTFRGYRASGILGASQGLSVYLDGVRINEAFGDVVNWDLVPEFALDSISLVSGANPAFGLNTLGGALSLTTASGLTAPGWRTEVSAGSHGRKRLDLASGGRHDGGWNHYVGIGLFDEDGWRDFSAGRLGTLLAKIGRATGAGDVSLSVLAGRSRLVGNGLTPIATLDDDGARTPDIGAARREAVYTHPDLTRNRLGQVGAQWQREFGDGGRLEALAYVRHARRTTVNGDEAAETEEEEEETAAAARRTRAERAGPGPAVTPIGSRVFRQAAGDTEVEANAAFNRTATRQRGHGASLALSRRAGAHQYQVGASLDRSRVHYEQTVQEGVFDETRGVQPLDTPPALNARVDGRSKAAGLYVTDTWQVAGATFLTGTLRHNRARVSNTLSSVDDDTGVFENRPSESFGYRSWNPALGVAHRVGPATVFANVARNTRVPTVIELGCADPEEPCRLPAGLQADPYLAQVVSTSIEAGVRTRPLTGWRGSVTLYSTRNRDDILFRSVSVNGQLGYFQNFPLTRNRGLDAELSTRVGAVDVGLSYSHLQATFEADGVLRQGERNVVIRPGTAIAGLPRHQLKASADWTPAPGWTVGADLQAYARRGVAGNEDGLLADDGDERVDLGLPGYGVVNLRVAWRPSTSPGLEVFARINNVGNRRYASFGALAETPFDAAGAFVGEESDALFVAPGAPRAWALGVRWRF